MLSETGVKHDQIAKVRVTVVHIVKNLILPGGRIGLEYLEPHIFNSTTIDSAPISRTKRSMRPAPAPTSSKTTPNP